MRALIFALRPETLERQGLIAALQAQIDNLAADVPAVVGTTPEKYTDLSIVDELVAAGFMKKP